KAYLVAYNTISAIAWGYILVYTICHLFNLVSSSQAKPLQTATDSFRRVLSYIPLFSHSGPNKAFSKVHSLIPTALVPIFQRAKTLYAAIGPQVAFVQSFAALEIVHVFLGLVRSPFVTTASQVASRLWTVWGVVEQFPETRTNPIYALMVLAWSMTEVIRYSFYAFNLVGLEPYPLLWLRYTTFYFLYPMGAPSEAMLMFSTLPSSSPFAKSWISGRKWGLWNYLTGSLFLIWWPALYILYTYMIRQRSKVLGKGKKTKTT
ncbi:hypothetical protein BOTBODRAFT_99627, partial [Botryobasidium botryosum FD-172 SS1]